MKESDTGIIIKKGGIIRYEMSQTYHNLTNEEYEKKYNERWVSLISLQKAIEKEKQSYPMDTSSNCIENASANDVLRWLLSLLEETKERKCRDCGQPGLIDPESMICDICYFAKNKETEKNR